MTDELTKSVDTMSLNTTSPVDYELMTSLQLFKDEQISKIKNSRDGFEKKIAQPSRTIKDFVDYIKYERSLLGKFKERMKQNNITVTADHPLITIVSDHMKELYTHALSIFTQNLRFWDEYIKFLQSFKNKEDISAAFDRMLEFHGDKPDVWIRAILWEYNENINDERIKSLLSRAQQQLPTAHKLYATCFRIELENKSKLDDVQAMQRAEAMYGSSRAHKFINAEFCIEMLEILDEFNYAQSIQQQILDDMQEMCPHSEIRWHTLAQRELKGLTAKIDCAVDFSGLIKMKCDSEGSKTEDRLATNASKRIDMNLKKIKIENLATPLHHTNAKRIELCIKTYEDAVKDTNSAKMWDYYLSAMIELNRDLSSQKEIKQNAMIKSFAGACQFDHLTEENYIQYIELLYQMNPSDENIEKVFQKATKNGRSVSLWLLCMRYYIQQNNAKKVRETFRVSKELLDKNGVEILELYMMYVKSSGHSDAHKEFKYFLTEFSRQHHHSLDQLKANILEMLASTAGMKTVQETYELFTKHYKTCDEIHAMMKNISGRQISFCK